MLENEPTEIPASLTEDAGIFCANAGKQFAYKLAAVLLDPQLADLLAQGKLAIRFRVVNGRSVFETGTDGE